MKKIYILSIVVSLLGLSVQSQSFDGKGDKKLELGYDLYGFGNGITARFDYGLSDLFSAGIGGSYFISNPDYDFYAFARTAIHLGNLFDFNTKFDVYPGVNIGFVYPDRFGFAGYLGMRFFFNESFGLFAEFGNTGSFGLSYTF